MGAPNGHDDPETTGTKDSDRQQERQPDEASGKTLKMTATEPNAAISMG